MAEEGKSGKRVVVTMLALVLFAGFAAWWGAVRLESGMPRGEAEGDSASASVLSEGVLYEARAGDPAVVIAKDVGSGKELWRAELGAVSTRPAISIEETVIEVQVAGTPWMTLDRSTGEPLE